MTVPRHLRRLTALGLVVIAITSAAVAISAAAAEQRRRGRRREPPVSLNLPNTPYDGKFTFIRLQYGATLGGGGGWGLPPWAHDYPRAERNFMKILDELTGLTPFLGSSGGNILSLGDPNLFKYPFAYMSEPASGR